MHTPTPHRSRLLGTLATVAVLVAALAGCGEQAPAGDAAASSAPTGSSSATGQAVDDAGFDAARDAYDLALAQCLRDSGFDVADPQPGQGIQETTPGIQEAASACTDEIGPPPTADVQVDDTEMLTRMLEEADCFRDLGFEVEEPTLGGALTVPEGATQEDMDACITAAQ